MIERRSAPPVADGRGSDVLDGHIVEALRDIGREPGGFLAEMATAFQAEAPLLFAEMIAAADVATLDTVAGTAHKLRGVSGHVGASRLAAACRDIELSARQGDALRTRRGLASAEREMNLALDATHTLLEEPR